MATKKGLTLQKPKITRLTTQQILRHPEIGAAEVESIMGLIWDAQKRITTLLRCEQFNVAFGPAGTLERQLFQTLLKLHEATDVISLAASCYETDAKQKSEVAAA
jgi:hypothetical protein